MIKSMTGYGTAAYENDNLSISIEIKTLNSKYCDVNIKFPKTLTSKELEFKNLITQRLERGKINCSIDIKKMNDDIPRININKQLFLSYFNTYQEIAGEVNVTSLDEIFKLSLQSPDVLSSDSNAEEVPETEMEYLMNTMEAAILNVNEFRQSEGKILKDEIAMYIRNIDNYLNDISNIDATRLALLKDRLRKNLYTIIDKDAIDENRFEQELLYYSEKLDISEEKVRLKSHLDYFNEMLELEVPVGKKLGFLTQEIGREINTIGSKANDAGVQKIVVQMKDELEKIKEQVFNIL